MMQFASSEPLLQADDVQRFSRQIICEGIGPKSMGRLMQAHVVIVGLGGLGSTAALYLAAAGIGHLTFIDGDYVEVSNLHRQVIHTTNAAYGVQKIFSPDNKSDNQQSPLSMVQQPMQSLQLNGQKRPLLKVDSARLRCKALRPEINITTVACYVTVDNVQSLLSCNCEVIVDCSDNMGVRYLINDAAIRLRVPVVSGSAMRWEGQLTVYGLGINDSAETHKTTCGKYNDSTINASSRDVGDNNDDDDDDDDDADAQKKKVHAGSAWSMGQSSKSTCPCYRCLYPIPPPMISVGNCSDTGVLGPIPGMIGCLQALQVIKIIARTGTTLAGRLFIFDGFNFTTRVVRLRGRQASCNACGEQAKKSAHLPLRAFINERPQYLRYCNNLCGAQACTRQHSSHQVQQTNHSLEKVEHGNAVAEAINETSRSDNNKRYSVNQQSHSISAEQAENEASIIQNKKHTECKVVAICQNNTINKDVPSHISVTQFAQKMKQTLLCNNEAKSNDNDGKHNLQNKVSNNQNNNAKVVNNVSTKQNHHQQNVQNCARQLYLCVDVRAPIQFDMAHLHNSFSLPLQTIQKWIRDCANAHALQSKWVEFIRSAAVQTWRAQCTHHECTMSKICEYTECHSTDNVWCDKDFVQYWLAIRSCTIFVICRRGIASVKAVHLLQKATDAINARHIAQTNDKTSSQTVQ